MTDELVLKVELEEKVDESEVEAGVGLLLAFELDELGLGLEELDGTVGVGEVGVLVELFEPDIVNCLPKTSFLGCL